MILLIAMAITCLLAAVANVIVTRMVGLNIFTVKVWLIVPVGAVGLGMLGASGAILAARYFNIQPTIIDAMLMVVVAAATMVLIYYFDYATFVLGDGRRATDLVDFATYLDLILTKTHMRMGRGGGVDTGEVGQMGYYLAGIEFLGFLIGGAATFFFIRGLWRCADCGSYLRKLKTKKTKELTSEEASTVIELFKAGDLETVQKLMAWAPPKRTLDRKDQKVLILFNLFGCPKCKAEVISARVNAFDGKEWKDVPSLTTRRNLSSGLSLRDQFA
jgi:hypothetical protein